MAANIVIVLTAPEVKQSLLDQLRLIGGNTDADRDVNAIASWLQGRIMGQGQGLTYRAVVGSVKASGTITFSALANNDTVTVNGRVYTAKTSGASGLQQFNLGANDTAAAVNFAAILNADTSTLVKGAVTASAAAGVVTITAVVPGSAGNFMTIAISAHGSVSGSGVLTSGSEGTAFTGVNG